MRYCQKNTVSGECSKINTRHSDIKNLHPESELDEISTTEDFSVVRQERAKQLVMVLRIIFVTSLK